MIDLSQQEKKKEKAIQFCVDAEHYLDIAANTMALQYFEHAEDIFISINDQHWLIYILHQKMKVYSQMEQFETALSIFPDITSGYFKNKNFKNLALALIHGAEVYYKMDNFFEAKNYFKIAENLIISRNISDLTNMVLSSLSILYSEQALYFDSLQYLKKAKSLPAISESEMAWIEEQCGINYEKLLLFNKAESEYKLSYQKYLKVGDYNAASRVMNALITHYESKELVEKAKLLKEKMIQINNVAIATKHQAKQDFYGKQTRR